MFPEPDPRDQIASREAHLLAIDEGPDAALRALNGKSDPESLARRLSILIEHGRLPEAVDLLKDRSPDQRWAHFAAYVLSRTGDAVGAELAVRSTQGVEDRVIEQRAAVGYAHGAVECIVARSGKGGRLLRGMLTEEDRKLLREIIAVLRTAFVFDQLENTLQEDACSLVLISHLALAEKCEAQPLVKVLESRTPVPLSLANAALADHIIVPDNLPARLRDEHPQSFEAKLKAALVEAGPLKRPGPAFAAAIALKDMAVSREDRLELLRALSVIADAVGSGARGLLDAIVPDLVNSDDSDSALFKADQYLKEGALDSAEALLEKIRDEKNPFWLHAAAQLRERRGDIDGALALFRQAATEHPHPMLLAHAGEFAYREGRLAVASEFLERVAEVDPTNMTVRKNLGVIYAQLGDFSRGVVHFQALHQAEPQNDAYAIRLAVSLALADRQIESLAVYDLLCAKPEAPLEAYVGRASVLSALNRPADACKALEEVRERFWDDPVFLLALMRTAYSADREELAMPALKQLVALEETGMDGSSPAKGWFIQKKSLDDLKAMLLEHREIQQDCRRQLLRGALPWLVAEPELRGIPYLIWATRTQPLSWVFEDPHEWSAHTLYATNGFTVVNKPGTDPSLLPISCPDAPTIVADLTGLMTLHRLGLLHTLQERFREVLIPASYFARVLDERVQLRPHQLSRQTASATLLDAVNSGKLGVVTSPGKIAPPFRIEEYTLDDDAQDAYRLTDLVTPLYEAGMLGDAEYMRLRELAHQPSATIRGKPPLTLGSRVICQLRTLETIATAGSLIPVLDGFALHVTEQEINQLKKTVAEYDFQKQVAGWHEDFWKQLGDQAKFARVPTEIPREWQQDDDELPNIRAASLEAVLIAGQRHVPLLADDRCCQVFVLNQEGARPSDAFGVDQFIAAQLADKKLSIQAAAQAFLQLMRWRYRFLIPPLAVLVECAHHFRVHPPGRELREIARYVHDSMRDPGLFGGLEPTDPPISMAVRFAEAWTALVGQFIVEVWADDRFTEESAVAITSWAIEELLPSNPKTLPSQFQRLVAMLAPLSVLSGALTQSLFHAATARTRKAFATLRQALDLPEEQYRRTVTQVIDGF